MGKKLVIDFVFLRFIIVEALVFAILMIIWEPNPRHLEFPFILFFLIVINLLLGLTLRVVKNKLSNFFFHNVIIAPSILVNLRLAINLVLLLVK